MYLHRFAKFHTPPEHQLPETCTAYNETLEYSNILEILCNIKTIFVT